MTETEEVYNKQLGHWRVG